MRLVRCFISFAALLCLLTVSSGAFAQGSRRDNDRCHREHATQTGILLAMERAKADPDRIAKQQAIVNKLWLDCVSRDWGPGGRPISEHGEAYYTFFADLGKPTLRDRGLPQSDQFVVNDGNYAAAVGGTFDFPVATPAVPGKFWWALGWYLMYLHATPNSVGNNNAPGILPVGGHDNTWAGFATAGARWRPFTGTLSPIELMGLVGLGLAYNNTSLLGTNGNELLTSKLTAAAWMARFALNYWLTDRFALGVFVAYLATREANALLNNGTTVPYGRPSSLVTGITLSISFGDDDGQDGVRSRYATPHR